NQQAVDQFTDLCASHQLPVAVQFRRQMLCSTTHPCFVGDVGLGSNPELMRYIKEADLVLLVGGRMPEVASQSYSLFDIPVPAQTLVHVHPDASELNRVYRADLGINVSPMAFAQALSGRSASQAPAWSGERDRLRASYLAWTDPQTITHPGQLQMGQVMNYLRSVLPDDAIMC